jgi:hypothetical protein
VDLLESKKRTYNISGVAYVYFNYKQQVSQTPSLIYTSLLAQLLTQIPDLQSPIEELYEKSGCGKKKPQTEDILKLLSNATNSTKVFLAFDALDEASDSTRAILLKQLQCLEDGKESLQVLMTSRPNVEVKVPVEKVRLIDVTARESDLKMFLRARLEENIELQDIEDPRTVIPQIIEGVLSHAAGM